MVLSLTNNDIGTWHTVAYHAESVDSLMNDTHELGGSTVVVDRATPKVINRSSVFFVSRVL